MRVIPFRHRYDKLRVARGERFTTIRGKSMMDALRVCQVVACQTPAGRFEAEVVSLAAERICDLPLAMLQADVAPFACASAADFVAFVNTLRAPWMPAAVADSEVCVITLKKI